MVSVFAGALILPDQASSLQMTLTKFMQGRDACMDWFTAYCSGMFSVAAHSIHCSFEACLAAAVQKIRPRAYYVDTLNCRIC